MRPKIDVIWNITRVCPWDCAQCCVDAYHVTKDSQGIRIRHDGLTATLTIQPSRSIFDAAAAAMADRGWELRLGDKLRVVDALQGFDADIDFSGGDPLVVSENVEVIAYAASKFSRDNISITATGAGMANYDAQALARHIHMIEFTYDHPDDKDQTDRPRGYNRTNLIKAREFKRFGCTSKAQTPLTPLNMRPAVLERIYTDLHEAAIDTVLLMRTFPTGRGMKLRGFAIPTRDEYRRAIDYVREMEARYGWPRVRLQCALKHLDGGVSAENPCDLLRESFGITNDGKLQLSAWAWDHRGRPLEDWIIGDLTKQSMAQILSSPEVQAIRTRLDDNFGHCKIFAYVFASRWSRDAMFERNDPLYALPQNNTPIVTSGATGDGRGRLSHIPEIVLRCIDRVFDIEEPLTLDTDLIADLDAQPVDLLDVARRLAEEDLDVEPSVLRQRAHDGPLTVRWIVEMLGRESV